MVSFIHNGNEKTTWIGYSFKTKTKNSNKSNIFKIGTSFLNFKLQVVRLTQGH